MTNREYLANMSNNELAGHISREFIGVVGMCRMCNRFHACNGECKTNVKAWLEAEYIENENTK